jgi:hypothetical protein
MSLAHSRLVVMVVYLCFLTRLLAVVLLPVQVHLAVELLPVVQLPQVLPVVALEAVLVQVQ